MARLPDALDAPALIRGAVVAGVVALPAGLAASVLSERDRPSSSGWLVALVLGALLFGAALAGWSQRRGTPITHGIVVAMGVFVAIQALGAVRRTVAGDGVSWSRVSSSLILSAVAGLIGGLLGGRLARTAPPPEPPGRDG